MERSSQEWIPRDTSEPIRQGDIFAWTAAGQRASPWRLFGVVITADCDLTHGKYGDVLSYCPIIPVLDFISLQWVPETRGKLLSAQVSKVHALVDRQKNLYSPSYDAPIAPELIIPWLQRRGANGLADDLGLPAGDHRAQLVAALDVLSIIQNLRCSGPLQEDIAVLARARCGLRIPPQPPCKRKPADSGPSTKLGSRVYQVTYFS